MLILISLAKLIQIPIRSIYHDGSEENSTKKDYLWKYFNRIYYPNSDEDLHSEIVSKPIVIFWWSNKTNTGIDPDCVIPFFPTANLVSFIFHIHLLNRINIFVCIRVHDNSSKANSIVF